MSTVLYDNAIVANAQQAVDFIGNILESSTEYSIIGKDLEGNILLWNEGARRLYGYEPEVVVGKANASILHTPEDVASGKAQEILDTALRDGKWEGTINRVRESGQHFTARVVITPRRDGAGQPIGFLLISKDISDEIRLTNELKATQFYTRSLIKASVDGLITVDPSGTISDVNEQMCRMSAFPREELIGTAFADYFAEPERATSGVKETFDKGMVTDYVLTLSMRDGRRLQVSFNASVFKDPAGSVRGIFASARDITEQARLQTQLADERAYNRGLIEASLDGLITVDAMLAITDVNDQMCRMSGYYRSELIGTPFHKYFTDAKRAAEGVRLTLDKGAVTNYELTLRQKGGQERLVSFNAAIFKDQRGSVRGIFASARDITEQARLQTQLADERAYNRGLIEASVDGLVTVDESMVITDVNETLCRLVGRLRNQLIGSPFADYFTERDRAAEGVRLTFQKGSVTNYVLTLQAADGRRVPVSFNAAIFKDISGEVQGIFASARDISEPARLQAQLAEQQAYNRSLIEASADALFAIAPDGVITDVNQEATRLTEFPRKHLVNSRFSAYFTEPERARAGVLQTLAEGRVIGYELVLVTRHGRRITVSFNAGVFTDAARTPLGILAAARDITAQKQLELQLRDQQFYTRSLIESNIDALMTTDPLGVITDVNQQMEALTGGGREELIGSPFKHYFTDPLRAEDGIRLVLRKGKVTNYELTARSKSGHETVVSYNAATLYDRDGKLQGVFAAARDITERKRFEQTLQEKNVELESANLAKDRFLASMSHELRTPLNAIIGFTGTLLMRLPGPLTADQDKQLKTIQASGRHLLSLINDLLDLAKIESGKVQIRPEPVALKWVLEEVALALGPLAEAKGLEFKVEVPREDPVVKTDRRALSQIVINLAQNAIKFTEKGEVRLELGRRPVNGSIVTEVAVSDTGVGIRAEDQAKLFQAFEQLDTTASRRYEGTGLGLHLSQKLAALIGGRISLKSEYGKGSTFTLTLPER